jgi:hypothetical protein
MVEAQQWAGYSLSQQQEIFEALLLLAGKGEWGSAAALGTGGGRVIGSRIVVSGPVTFS